MDRYRFDQLVRDHLPQVHRLAIRLTGRIDLARDLVQEAVLRATNGWRSLHAPERFRAWMYRITINAWRDEMRRAAPPGALIEDLSDPHSIEAGERAQARELGELIAARVSALPPRQREVLILVAYESHSTTEAASVLAMSEQNVRTTLHLAREKLRHDLAAYLTGTARERAPQPSETA